MEKPASGAGASARAAPTSSHKAAGHEGRGSEQLLLAIAQHDRSAFEELLERYAGEVHAVARSVLRDPAPSEDVTREVFLEIWATASRFDRDRSSARAWVLATAHRRAVERLRSLRADPDREEPARRAGQLHPADETDEPTSMGGERPPVRDALEELSAPQRAAVRLAYYEGFTYREIAERLGTPFATVAAHLRDGLVRLRDALRITP